MRSRGPKGGGTRCSGTPQLLQRSEWAWSTRNQWPRASHSGLMHCTVQPGRYCTPPPVALPFRATLRGKVGGIVWQGACGVKHKATISRGRLAGLRRPQFAAGTKKKLTVTGRRFPCVARPLWLGARRRVPGPFPPPAASRLFGPSPRQDVPGHRCPGWRSRS